MKKIVYIITIITIALAIYIYLPKSTKTDSIRINNNDIYIEYADTVQKRTQGLSGRESLEIDQGMLFVFPYSDIYGFWMKDMKFSIDILWLDETYTIVDITDSLHPSSYPETVFPKQKVQYVLELNENAIEEYKIKIGDVISFVRK